jgi:hypothetical protein
MEEGAQVWKGVNSHIAGISLNAGLEKTEEANLTEG